MATAMWSAWVSATNAASAPDQTAAGPAAGTVMLVVGDPAGGFIHIGPVTPNDPDVEEFIDTHLAGRYWWYVPVRPLSEAAAIVKGH